ncbi:MAG: type II secretion system major pseudopilin GspG [Phycisphaeraceae bacterium]|nr:type II secretion system major pseudopilin GspG [Phycisphaeraceae bacterium]
MKTDKRQRSHRSGLLPSPGGRGVGGEGRGRCVHHITRCCHSEFRPHPSPLPRGEGARRRAAFTLVEIMVVVIIIGVLAAMIVVPYFGKAGQAKQSVAKHDISVLESAVNMFQQDYGRFPANLGELVTKPGDISDDQWSATGIKASNLNDPWGRPFNYVYPGTNWAFEITSYGADGQPGGEGENADVNNWE